MGARSLAGPGSRSALSPDLTRLSLRRNATGAMGLGTAMSIASARHALVGHATNNWRSAPVEAAAMEYVPVAVVKPRRMRLPCIGHVDWQERGPFSALHVITMQRFLPTKLPGQGEHHMARSAPL